MIVRLRIPGGWQNFKLQSIRAKSAALALQARRFKCVDPARRVYGCVFLASASGL